MANFNLLPQELAPKESYIKLAAKLKKIAIVGYSIFLIATVTIFAIFSMISKNVEESEKKESELLTSIKAMKETEQRLILTQDRLTNARTILGMPNSIDKIAVLKDYVNQLPDNVHFSSAAINTDGMTVNLNLGGSDDLSSLLSQMYAKNVFKQIVMTNFSYTDGENYNLGFKLGI